MTKWTEFPLRPQGQAWPGLNTRGGRLDPGAGQLEDGSFNAIINEADILEKRKGLVRGLNERFDGVVCGLFRYTDDCGVEYVVVADQDGIKVRQPFNIPSFLGSDSLPNDDFESLNTSRWSNTTDYETFLGSLQLTIFADLVTDDFVPASRLMQWFKASVLTSYQSEIQYAFNAGGHRQVAAVAIKRSDSGTSFLQANVVLDGSDYYCTLQLVQSGTRSTLVTKQLQGSALGNGFLRLGYNAETRVATIRVIPSGGSQITETATLTELQDDGLGQNSAVGIANESQDDTPEILQVTGSALS